MKVKIENPVRTTSIALRALIATLVPQFAFGLSYTWIALSPHAQQEGWSPVVVGAIFALTPLSSAITLLVGSRLPTILPLRRLCWVGVSLLVAGLAVAFLFPNEFTFLVFFAMLALGVGYGITLLASLAAIAQVFPGRIGTAEGMLTAAYSFAAIAEVPVIGLLIPGHAWIDALRIAGTIVTVLDLGVRLNPSSAPIAEGSIVLLRHRDRLVGIVVEEVLDLRTLEIDDGDAVQPGEKGTIVRGMATLDDAPVVVLDLDALIKQVLLS